MGSKLRVSNRCLIRCDFSTVIGYGHVVRSLALADELSQEFGWQVSFLVSDECEQASFVEDRGYACMLFSIDAPDSEQKAISQSISDQLIDLLILDVRTPLASAELEMIRNQNITVVTIDDSSDRRLVSDLCFFPPVKKVSKLNWRGYQGKYYVGGKWVPLRRQFANKLRELRENPQNNIKDGPVVVSMGGSDPHGLTILVLNEIARISQKLEIEVVIGPGFLGEQHLLNTIRASHHNIKLHKVVDDMSEIFARAKLLVASFGGTAYEAASIGTPMVLLCLTEDHYQSASALQDAGCATIAGSLGQIKPDAIVTAIKDLLGASHKRKNMGDAGIAFIDAAGAYKVAEKIHCSITLHHED